MDFEAAIVAHMRWKFRLTDYVAGKSTEKLDPSVIECDDKCDLGKWIHSCSDCDPRAKSFVELREAHAAFHRSAAEVVRETQAGRATRAAELLGPNGAYTKQSIGVINLIKALKQKTAA